MRSADQETTAIEKMVCYTHGSQEKRTYHATGGYMKKSWDRSGGREREERVGRGLSCGFCRQEQKSRVSKLRIG